MVTGAGPCKMPKARASRKSACKKGAKVVQDAADGRQWITKRILQHGLRINGHHAARVETNLDRICRLRTGLVRELVIPRPLTIIASYDLILQALVDDQLIALVGERHALGDAVLLIECRGRLTWMAERLNLQPRVANVLAPRVGDVFLVGARLDPPVLVVTARITRSTDDMDIIRCHATSVVKQNQLDASNTERSNLFIDGRLLEERCQVLPQGLSVPLQLGNDQHSWVASLRLHAAQPCVCKVALKFDRQASTPHTVDQGR